MAKQRKYYVVWEGQNPGIYDSWDACQKQIHGFSGAKYKAFPSRAAAEAAFAGDYESSLDNTPRPRRKTPPKPDHRDVIVPSVCVDAACSGNPGVMEYQGVLTETGEAWFQRGPYPEGTVNIGEFLAIVHALSLLERKELDWPVYSDSQIAIGWVAKRRANTKLPRRAVNEPLFRLLRRAETWLQTHAYANPVLKWQTRQWGEIPADFGRK